VGATELGNSGNPLSAMGAGMASAQGMKLLQSYAPATAAWAARGTGKGMVSIAEKMASRPDLAGKYAKVLQSAALRGPDALSVTHFKLSERPDYQLLVKVAGEEEESRAEK
jgi:hypothetical protein